MNNVDFRFVWRQDHEGDIASGVRRFWSKLGIVFPPGSPDRLSELCAVASVEGEVVATSTAKIVQNTGLRERFAYYRTLVMPELRRQKLAQRLCAFSRDSLAKWAQENPNEGLKGLLIVFQAREFAELDRSPVAHLPDLEFNFVGYNDDGERMRVIWFGNATLE
jgi:hypothetical protein